MSENIAEVLNTDLLIDDDLITEEDSTLEEEQLPVSTRIPELSNILLVGDEEFYINAKRAEEASKVSEKLFINCVGPKNVTQIAYDGERQKNIYIVPATGGTFKGPLFAKSSIKASVSENTEGSINDEAVVVAGDFAALYTKHIEDIGGIKAASATTAASALRADYAEQAGYADETDYAKEANYAGTAGQADYAGHASTANQAIEATKADTLQIIKTDDSDTRYINLYLGLNQPSEDAPIGSIWLKTNA